MLDWMSPIAFLQTMIRVLLVWCAFYWVGHMLEKPLRMKRLFPLLPKEITGILAMMVLTLLLSLFGIMNRTVTPIILMLLSLPGLLMIVQKFVRKISSTRFSLYTAVFALVFIAVALLNFTYASMPNLQFDDPLITYAVQPDKWLNAGRMYWIQETAFSGFPLTYEMTAVWPASLTFDRIDQLSVLQVFQMSLLLVAVFRGLQILQIRKKLWLPFAVIVLLCTMLYYWCSLAKTDTAAILFCTLALASALRELSQRDLKPYTSWLFMGLALATKQTSIIVLAAFLPYGIWRVLKESWKVKIIALACLAAVPLLFAVRTMSVTGSPTYPFYQINSLVRDEWRLQAQPEEIRLLNDRSSYIYSSHNYTLLKNIGIFLTSMEGILLVLLSGLVLSLSLKSKSQLLLFLPLLLYFAMALKVLWPPWWGAKYTILMYPFAGLIGMRSMQKHYRTAPFILASVSMIAFVVPGFIAVPVMNFPACYRYAIASSVLQGSWDSESEYRVAISTTEGMTHMWLNSYLTDSAVILSLHEEKRYFCDHEVYVGWRHPAVQKLYLENTLAEECAILDSLSVDFITVYRGDPVTGDMENRLMILDNIGLDNILVPFIRVSGDFVVYKYNSMSIRKLQASWQNL